MKPAPSRPFRSRAAPGMRRVSRRVCRTSTSEAAPPSCSPSFIRPQGRCGRRGFQSSANAVLHPWLREQLLEILSALPAREGTPTEEEIRADWQSWQEGLSLRPTLPETLPRLRMLLVLDNLTGHKSSEFVLWCFAQGIALLYTPLGGSWMNMTESLQRIVARRALEGTHPKSAEQIITWLEAAVARVARTRRRTRSSDAPPHADNGNGRVGAVRPAGPGRRRAESSAVRRRGPPPPGP